MTSPHRASTARRFTPEGPYPAAPALASCDNVLGSGTMTKRTTGVAALLCPFLFGCSSEPPIPSPVDESQEAIIGGVDDSGTGAHPAVVMLVNGNGACTASLIAPKLVLTARHCVSQNLQPGIGCDIYGNSTNGNHVGNDFSPGSFDVFTGVNPNFGSPAASGAQLFHPPGQNLCNNDIALLVLDKAIATTPLKVRLDWGPQEGELTTAVGYGSINDAQQGSGKRRRRTNVPVYTAGQDWNHLTGAGELAVGQAACAGDSGGPVISTGGAVIGVASRVANCNDPNTSAKYVRLDYHKALILQAFAAAGASPSHEAGSPPTPPPKKQIGEGPCTTGADCASALCQTAGSSHCTDFCAQSGCNTAGMYCADGQIAISGGTIEEKFCTPIPTGTPCEQCRATDCVNLVTTCLNDAECSALLACADQCGDPTCHDACVAQHPGGADDYESLRECTCQSSCPSVCSHQCTGIGGAGGSAGAGGIAGAGGSAGTAGSGATGGSGGVGAAAGVGGTTETPASSGQSGRQGCSASAAPASGASLAWLAAALCVLARRRRLSASK